MSQLRIARSPVQPLLALLMPWPAPWMVQRGPVESPAVNESVPPSTTSSASVTSSPGAIATFAARAGAAAPTGSPTSPTRLPTLCMRTSRLRTPHLDVLSALFVGRRRRLALAPGRHVALEQLGREGAVPAIAGAPLAVDLGQRVDLAPVAVGHEGS